MGGDEEQRFMVFGLNLFLRLAAPRFQGAAQVASARNTPGLVVVPKNAQNRGVRFARHHGPLCAAEHLFVQ